MKQLYSDIQIEDAGTQNSCLRGDNVSFFFVFNSSRNIY